MQEFIYNTEDDEPKQFTVDEEKADEIIDTIFQYLRETGVADVDDVQASRTNESSTLELVEKIIELLDITDVD